MVAIGAGTGGIQSVIHAASRGAKCALVSRADDGGECLHFGCIPTKSMVRSMEVHPLVKNASTMGIDILGDVKVNFSGIMARQESIISGILDRVYKALTAMRIDFFEGVGSIVSQNMVKVKLNKPQ